VKDFLKRFDVKFADIIALRLLRKNIIFLLKYREANVFTINSTDAKDPRIATCT
jgi:hypothetical protein